MGGAVSLKKSKSCLPVLWLTKDIETIDFIASEKIIKRLLQKPCYRAILFIIEWSKHSSTARPNGKWTIFVFDPSWSAKLNKNFINEGIIVQNYRDMYYHLAGRMATAVEALEATTTALATIAEKLKLAQQAAEDMYINDEDNSDNNCPEKTT
jgi:hypothetical protein